VRQPKLTVTMTTHKLSSVLLLIAACTSDATSNMGKSTYACSEKAATNAYDWEIKYLPVTESTDDCEDRTCKCGKQSRVQFKGSRFALHCTYAGGEDDSRAAANGGLTETKLEGIMATAIGNWSTYDTDMNAVAWSSYGTGLWASSGLDWYVDAFKTDSVDYHLGSWTLKEDTYWSLLVLIPDTPVVLEIMGTCTVCGDASTQRMPHGYKGASIARSSVSVSGSAPPRLLSGSYISRAVSNLSAVVEFYDSVYGLAPSSNSTLDNGVEILEFIPGGENVPMRYVHVPGQTGTQTTDWFQTTLLDAAAKYQTSPSACWTIWGDLHNGGIFGTQTILEQVTKAAELGYVYRSFNGGEGPNNAYMLEPSGAWSQIGGSPTGLPESGGFDTEYCYTFCEAR